MENPKWNYEGFNLAVDNTLSYPGDDKDCPPINVLLTVEMCSVTLYYLQSAGLN